MNRNAYLSAVCRFDLRQSLTRIYGPLTGFNFLFKEKEDQFVS